MGSTTLVRECKHNDECPGDERVAAGFVPRLTLESLNCMESSSSFAGVRTAGIQQAGRTCILHLSALNTFLIFMQVSFADCCF